MPGIIEKLVGGSIAEPITAVGNVLDQLFTSDEERLTKQEAMLRLAQEPHMAQIELNKLEAQHRSIFVAGWRPFIGWVCGIALAYHFIIRDLLVWAFINWAPDLVPPPQLAMEHLMTVVVSLLGLGGLRSFEKFTGKAK